MITRYECDVCGEEKKGEPAAYIDKSRQDVCGPCFDEHMEQTEVTF